MSDLPLNLVPPPELLNATGTGPLRPRPDAAPASPGAANPFAALLAGVLGGTQSLAPAARGPAFPGLPVEATAPDGTGTGSPAGSAELPGDPAGAAAATLDITLPGLPAGNGLPAGGNGLPVADDADAVLAPRQAPPAGRATDAPAPPPAARAPVSLADLALARPLEPVSAPPGAPAEGAALPDGARQAAAYTMAGRLAATAGERAAAAAPTAPALPAPTGAAPETLVSTLLPARQPGLRLAGTGVQALVLPGAGNELMAGQLAAFAASPEAPAGTGAAGTGLTGTVPPDTGSAAFLSRAGSTGLPPLQPLGDAGAFAGGLADRLLTLGGPGAHSARLKLHPEHLGELDVEITMEDGSAQVWFGTTTTQARDAIEGSLPRLRELFAEQGIQLTRTQVDAGSSQPGSQGHGPGDGQQRQMTGGAAPWRDAAWRTGRAGTDAASPGATAPASSRLLDVWA